MTKRLAGTLGFIVVTGSAHAAAQEDVAPNAVMGSGVTVLGASLAITQVWATVGVVYTMDRRCERLSATFGGSDNGCARTEDFVPLFVPLIGPFLAMSRTQVEGWREAFAVLGVAQNIGHAAIVAGAVLYGASPEQHAVRVVPLAGSDGGGIGFDARF